MKSWVARHATVIGWAGFVVLIALMPFVGRFRLAVFAFACGVWCAFQYTRYTTMRYQAERLKAGAPLVVVSIHPGAKPNAYRLVSERQAGLSDETLARLGVLLATHARDVGRGRVKQTEEPEPPDVAHLN